MPIAAHCRAVNASWMQTHDRTAAIGGVSDWIRIASRGPISNIDFKQQTSHKKKPKNPEIPNNSQVRGEASLGNHRPRST